MTVLEAIAAFLVTLPKLEEDARDLVTWINHVSGNDVEGFLNKLHAAFTALHGAEDDAALAEAARGIQRIIRGSA